ncbi:MAG: hypothetical protein HY720_25260 [Planctomycetes bacterium]|nr:hypothetical protein [Planctomycetota bacterium]
MAGARRRGGRDAAGIAIARGIRNLRLAAGSFTVLALVVLVAGSLTTAILSYPGYRTSRSLASQEVVDLAVAASPPAGVKARAAGDADWTRRRFYYLVDVDTFGRREGVLLIEYFPLRLSEDRHLPAGRILERSDDPGDRLLHEKPGYERPLGIEKGLSLEGVSETTPPAILGEFRKICRGEVLTVGILEDGGWTEREAEVSGRALWLGAGAFVVGLLLSLALLKPLRRVFFAPRSA